jgi:outer membrane protein assembly factor BamB
MKPLALFAVVSALAPGVARALAADWPQFRGPNAVGRCPDEAPLPEDIGPDRGVIWKVPVPPGHSSPAVVGDRVYLTAVKDKVHLVTIALDRATGKVLWEAEAPAGRLEQVHQIGSLAQASPAADVSGVVALFGSHGLVAYDRTGRLVWDRPLGPFKNDFGAASSPVIVGDRVVLGQDHDQHSFLEALDRKTGKTVWRADRSEFLRGFATPVVWESGGRRQVVVAGTLRVVGYDLETGKEVWTARGISRTVCATPAVGADGRLYVAGYSAGGDPADRIEVPPFDEVVKALDKNANGRLEAGELPAGPIKQRFTQVDLDKDGSISKAEYERFRGLFRETTNVVLAIRPGGAGDVTDTHVAWRQTKHVPFCASPLSVGGVVFAVADGGVLATLDARDGRVVWRDRLEGAGGAYYASPVTGNGKVYLVSERGRLTVVSGAGEWKELATADFKESVYATPALADGRIYLRTSGHLYCLGRPDRERR